MQSIQDGLNYVSGKASELTSTESKEANKNIAKDSNQDLGTRASATKDAAGDKANELKESATSEVDKERLKH